jgi:large subunit ribosomal protein L24
MKKMQKLKKSHVKKGDQVKVISGEQKGFLGKINSIIKKKSSVILDGILPRFKFLKNSKTEQNEETKKIELPILIHISNVMLWDKTINKASRIGYKEIKENAVSDQKNLNNLITSKKSLKKRYFKKSGNFVPEIQDL